MNKRTVNFGHLFKIIPHIMSVEVVDVYTVAFFNKAELGLVSEHLLDLIGGDIRSSVIAKSGQLGRSLESSSGSGRHHG